ncbi:DNA replication complex GINS protein PSF2, putative [Pediculus humanus corporis]|uniref:GINS complex subunit 2 n=1 Tax=Pediculus humanus subsp. corporis TaxID=121224 RepID=E0VHX1_PEDHC|nr:DNA replication complex GINS protein PSF2, putative [Pediculus humanus corporis]EEB12977.1 DNA replication complex GINS protein PSF2, putative [Pediculus humanus corporis]
MEPAEIEFLAEEKYITIIPRFHCRKTYFITGELGPFRAGIPLKVPLWLARDLKRRQKCHVLTPEWLDLENLSQLNADEVNSVKFIKLPSENYFIGAKIILGFGVDVNFFSLMTAVKDLWDKRKSKLEDAAEMFLGIGMDHVVAPKITTAEINIVRPLLPELTDFLNRLASTEITRPERLEDSENSLDESFNYSNIISSLNVGSISTIES